MSHNAKTENTFAKKHGQIQRDIWGTWKLQEIPTRHLETKGNIIRQIKFKLKKIRKIVQNIKINERTFHLNLN